MKIFTLETRKHLIGWSILLGVPIGWKIFNLTSSIDSNLIESTTTSSGYIGEVILYFGFPFRQSVNVLLGYEASFLIINWVINIIIWIIITFFILWIIKTIRGRKK